MIKKAGNLKGILNAKGDAWIEVKEDQGLLERYLAPWQGGSPARGGGFDLKTLGVFKELVVGNRVRVGLVLGWSSKSSCNQNYQSI